MISRAREIASYPILNEWSGDAVGVSWLLVSGGGPRLWLMMSVVFAREVSFGPSRAGSSNQIGQCSRMTKLALVLRCQAVLKL